MYKRALELDRETPGVETAVATETDETRAAISRGLEARKRSRKPGMYKRALRAALELGEERN
jgi:hypothetical protein